MPRFTVLALVSMVAVAIVVAGYWAVSYDQASRAARRAELEARRVHLVNGSTAMWRDYRATLPENFDRWRQTVRVEEVRGEVRQKSDGTDKYGTVYTYLLIDRFPGVTFKVAGLVDAEEGEVVRLSTPVRLSCRAISYKPHRAEFFEEYCLSSARADRVER